MKACPISKAGAIGLYNGRCDRTDCYEKPAWCVDVSEDGDQYHRCYCYCDAHCPLSDEEKLLLLLDQ